MCDSSWAYSLLPDLAQKLPLLLLCQILDRECTGFIWHTCDMSDVIKTEVYDVCCVKYIYMKSDLTPNPLCDHLLPSPASGHVSSFWLQ